MLKIKMSYEKVKQALEYHAEDGEGICTVIDDSTDLKDWFLRFVKDRLGDDDANQVIIAINGNDVLVSGSNDLIDLVKSEIL